jgi:hypothetical protein
LEKPDTFFLKTKGSGRKSAFVTLRLAPTTDIYCHGIKPSTLPSHSCPFTLNCPSEGEKKEEIRKMLLDDGKEEMVQGIWAKIN